MSAGSPFAGRRVAPASSLLVLAEHSDADVSALLQEARAGAGARLGDKQVYVRRRFSIEDEAQVASLAAEADSRGVSLVAIDPIRAVTLSDENRSNDVAGLRPKLRAIGGDGRRTVMVSHHTGRSGAVRGSTDWEAQADVVIRLDRARGSDVVQLAVTGHGRSEFKARLRFTHAGGKLVVTSEATAPPAADEADILEAKIAEYVARNPGCTGRAIDDAIQGGRKVRTAREQLIAAGALRREGGRGRGGFRYSAAVPVAA